MSTTRVTTAVALIATLALSALPVAAQDGRQESGSRRDGQSRGERRRPRDSGNREGAQSPQGPQGRQGPRADSAGGGDRSGDQATAVPRANGRERQDERRAEQGRPDRDREANRDYDRDRGRGRDANRDYDRGRDRSRDYGQNRNRDFGRDRDRNYGRNGGRPYVVAPAPRGHRGSPYRQRSYVVPYGYRPYGYRPGWSLNLYFGRPNYAYGSRGYYGGGNSGNYGYYAIPQGFGYGSLRIVDAPRDAQVFVDGYYAGVVDDYDGVFQRLNLEPGRHQLEVEVDPGAPPAEYDVYVAPGQTVTVHVEPYRPYRP